MTAPIHIPQLLHSGTADDTAFSAPDRPDLTYAGLRGHVERTVAALNRRGIGRNDRVAIVLPNGPEMASGFVAIAAGATTAPLNPAYRQPEFEFYLEDLGARGGWWWPRGMTRPPAQPQPRSVCRPSRFARSRAIPRAPFPSSAGPTRSPPLAEAWPGPDDVALVLHTSGTTSRPKIVPLLHRNVCATAENIRRTLGLEAGDRCLNVMPLFPHPRADGVRAFDAACGRERLLRAGVQRAKDLRVAGRRRSHVVLGCAHDAPGDPRAGGAQCRSRRAAAAALHPVLFGGAAVAGHGRARGGVRRARRGGLRDDRGRAPDDLQPAAPRGPQTRHGGNRRGPRCLGDGRRRKPPCSGRRGRDRHPGAERHAGLREQRGREPRGLHARVVPHRRPGFPRRGTGTSRSRGASRRSSTGAGRRSRRARSTRC